MTELDFLHYLSRILNRFHALDKELSRPTVLSTNQPEFADIIAIRGLFYYFLGYLEGGIAAVEAHQVHEEDIDKPAKEAYE